MYSSKFRVIQQAFKFQSARKAFEFQEVNKMWLRATLKRKSTLVILRGNFQKHASGRQSLTSPKVVVKPFMRNSNKLFSFQYEFDSTKPKTRFHSKTGKALSEQQNLPDFRHCVYAANKSQKCFEWKKYEENFFPLCSFFEKKIAKQYLMEIKTIFHR